MTTLATRVLATPVGRITEPSTDRWSCTRCGRIVKVTLNRLVGVVRWTWECADCVSVGKVESDRARKAEQQRQRRAEQGS